MTMLEIMKERVPAGVDIINVAEKPSKYELILFVDGEKVSCWVPKACTPGSAETVVDFAICTTMIGLYLERGDLKNAKKWKDKQMSLVGIW